MAAGHAPRILLISHPQNPLGICYPSSIVQECIDWCRSNKVHLVSDEIYAGSIYRPSQAGFQSALQLAADDNSDGLGPFIHWVYALSKDFCLSGLRVGAVYTENEVIHLPLQKLNDLCQIASTTQAWTASTLTRKNSGGRFWVESFRDENHNRLNARSKALMSCLRECDIPFLEPSAGLFLWMDLSKYLPNESIEGERQLYMELVNNFGLLLTPGWSMRNEKPGFFRCVFTAASEEEFTLSLDRFRAFAASRQRL
jgi:aspartate/methionine/tyrosine aminotransferase